MFWARKFLVLLLVVLLTLGTFVPTEGCETPVYRYAMYRWAPAAYVVYFFHDQTIGPLDRLVAERLSKARQSDEQANVMHLPVNVTSDAELANLPPEVREIWSHNTAQSPPFYVMLNPQGAVVHQGAMVPHDLPSMLQSPARQQVGRLLQDGKIGVFVYVPGTVIEQNQRVEKELEELRADLAAGKVTLRAASASEPPAAEEASLGRDELSGDPAAAAAGTASSSLPPAAGAVDSSTDTAGADTITNPRPNVAATTATSEATATASSAKQVNELGIVTVRRDDPAETWFVRSLLALEADLESEQQPMVFLVYGRARSLLPYIGPGITRDNLVHELQFISGACSCTVKEQNPGIDLLVQFDWEAASASLAERFGVEEGNEQQFGPGGFFPELIIPSGAPAPVASTPAAAPLASDDPASASTRSAELLAAAEAAASGEATVNPTAETIDSPDAETAAARNESLATATVPKAIRPSAVSSVRPEAAQQAGELPVSPTAPSATVSSGLLQDSATPELASLPSSTPSLADEALPVQPMVASWVTIALGLVVALFVLVGITFVVMRPR